MDMNPDVIVWQVLEWLGWTVMVVGLVVCAMNLRLSRWIWLIMAGQAGHLAVGLAYRFLLDPSLISDQSVSYLIALSSSLFNVILSAFIVAGLAGMFHDLRANIRLLTHMAMDGRQADGR